MTGPPLTNNRFLPRAQPNPGGLERSIIFLGDLNANDGTYRVHNIGTNGTHRFSFSVPEEAGAIVAVRMVGWATAAGAVGAGKDIDLFSEYGADGEAKDFNAESDITTTYTIPAVDELFTINLLTVFSALAAGDRAGIRIDHMGIGGNVAYLGVELVIRLT